ncbi:MAG TPA: heterodisulfide reductase-related iron-sulfur binding cluster, partial [Acidimicrobiia bacterium]|nr:heterodisulfide reductase-related iron-sulfur binding cluster [Acidimicrobiia bacterium]
MAQHLYDPLDPGWFSAPEIRAERDRTFHICTDCRVCVKLCPSFKSLFAMIDDLGGSDRTSELSDAQHKRVVDECYQCKLCYVICPYTPDQGQEWRIDFPQLMLRSLTAYSREGKVSRSARLLARTDEQGKVATTLAPVVNATAKLKPARVVMEKVTGIGRDRLLPTFVKTRFSTWFKRRPVPARGEAVALFPTCLAEYQEPAIGRAMVGVLERNNYRCALPEGQVCCGMPWLDAGDVDKFREAAQKNVDALLPAVDAGMSVLVPQPTCAYTLKD